MEQLEKLLSKLPIIPVVMIGACYLAYGYYDWLNSANSELGQKKAQFKQSKETLESTKKKLADAEKFYHELDAQRLRIRQLTTQLANTKATLNTEVDVSNFIRMVTLEAKKLRLSIKSIKPVSSRTKDYYVEVPFNVQMKGAYVQMLLFLDRITKLQQLIRVTDISMKPTASVYTKYVELDGTAQLVAFKYLGTSADEIANKLEIKDGAKAGTM